MNEDVAQDIREKLFYMLDEEGVDLRLYAVGHYLLDLNKALGYRDIFGLPIKHHSTVLHLGHATLKEMVNRLIEREIIYEISEAISGSKARKVSFIKPKTRVLGQTPLKIKKNDKTYPTWIEEG